MKITLTDNGFMPIKQTTGSAGFDIYSPCDGELSPEDGKRIRILDTGILFNLDENKQPEISFRVNGRSGFGLNFGLSVSGGVHDTGELFLKMELFGNKPFIWKREERIAQLLLFKSKTNN
ncbi:Deoxyuridine 5'-triphosphate nucleotidohydrolase [Cucumispora dikerogammari]|nr:Deoxyuridine 5'-triphosphate nucleotidohydrolase [Cucumispora dikerogammari]